MQLFEGPERLPAVAYAHNRVVGEDMGYESEVRRKGDCSNATLPGKVSLKGNIPTVKRGELYYNLRMYAFIV